MTLARSKITAQGQISIPAEVRRRLGVGPGSVLEWNEEDEKIVVRRSAESTFEQIHRAAFPEGSPSPRTLEELKEGIRQAARERHARH